MNPEKTSPNNYQASTSATAEIVSGLRQTRPFLLQDHKNTVNAAREAHKERMFAEHKSSLDKALTNPTKTTPPSRVLDRAKSTGIWLSIVPMHTTNSVLSSLEFRDALQLRYGLTPTNLPTHCDGCQTPFTIGHALTCKKGGLVTLRHNELRDELKAIATTIFPPSAVRVEPFIHPAQPHTNASPPHTPPNHSSTSSP